MAHAEWPLGLIVRQVRAALAQKVVIRNACRVVFVFGPDNIAYILTTPTLFQINLHYIFKPILYN